MSAPLPEIVRWKYHARELQANAIIEQADRSIALEVEAHADQFRRLNAILATPPIFLSSVINSFQEDEEQFYIKASTALGILAKRVRTLDVLKRLAKACGEEALPVFKEVAIDFIDHTTSLPVKLVFKNREAVLEQMVSEGREEAVKKILDLTQGEVPLMRYRRDLAIIKFPLSPTIDQGLLGYAPTKIDNVDLRFYYSKTETLPHLSFGVNPYGYG